MSVIIRSPESDADVFEIATYISADNPQAANRLIDRFDEALKRLADFPGMGPMQPELAAGVRSLPVGNYLLFYRPIDNGIELVRVLHGARNPRRVFRRSGAG